VPARVAAALPASVVARLSTLAKTRRIPRNFPWRDLCESATVATLQSLDDKSACATVDRVVAELRAAPPSADAVLVIRRVVRQRAEREARLKKRLTPGGLLLGRRRRPRDDDDGGDDNAEDDVEAAPPAAAEEQQQDEATTKAAPARDRKGGPTKFKGLLASHLAFNAARNERLHNRLGGELGQLPAEAQALLKAQLVQGTLRTSELTRDGGRAVTELATKADAATAVSCVRAFLADLGTKQKKQHNGGRSPDKTALLRTYVRQFVRAHDEEEEEEENRPSSGSRDDGEDDDDSAASSSPKARRRGKRGRRKKRPRLLDAAEEGDDDGVEREGGSPRGEGE